MEWLALSIAFSITAIGATIGFLLLRRRRLRSFRALHLIVMLVPLAWFGLYFAIVLRARVHLGFWPYPGHIDAAQPFPGIVFSPLNPKVFEVHHAVLKWLEWSSVASLFFDAGMFLGSVRSRELGIRRHTLVAHALSHAVFWIMGLVDPFGWTRWLAD